MLADAIESLRRGRGPLPFKSSKVDAVRLLIGNSSIESELNSQERVAYSHLIYRHASYRGCVKTQGTNAEGVGQFQPRVQPRVGSPNKRHNTEGVGETKQPVYIEVLLRRPRQPFQGLTTQRDPAYPGCYPGLKFANAFGVSRSDFSQTSAAGGTEKTRPLPQAVP